MFPKGSAPLTIEAVRAELRTFSADLKQELKAATQEELKKLSSSLKDTFGRSYKGRVAFDGSADGPVASRSSPDLQENAMGATRSMRLKEKIEAFNAVHGDIETSNAGDNPEQDAPELPWVKRYQNIRAEEAEDECGYEAGNIDSSWSFLGLAGPGRGRNHQPDYEALQSVQERFESEVPMLSPARTARECEVTETFEDTQVVDAGGALLSEGISKSASRLSEGGTRRHQLFDAKSKMDELYHDDDNVSEASSRVRHHHHALEPKNAMNRKVQRSKIRFDDWRSVVDLPVFTNTITGVVVLNSIFFGVQTQFMAINWMQTVPSYFFDIDVTFCFIFVTEITLRLCCKGPIGYFFRDQWAWNTFDFLTVFAQVVQVYDDSFNDRSSITPFDHGSSFRMLRIVRVARLTKVLHSVAQLRMLVVAVTNAMSHLVWVMTLIGMIVYVMAVFITQSVTDYKVRNMGSAEEAEKNRKMEELLEYYGSLDRTFLSLYAMLSDGIHWMELMEPLTQHISPWYRLHFFLFSAFALIAVMNVIMGAFVEGAISTANQDRKYAIAEALQTLFEEADIDDSGVVTWEQFQVHLESPALQACLKEVDVDTQDAKDLFRLLDIDGSGRIDERELVHGAINLMGQAKAVDLASFMLEYRNSTLRFTKHSRHMQEAMKLLMDGIQEIQMYMEDLDNQMLLVANSEGESLKNSDNAAGSQSPQA